MADTKTITTSLTYANEVIGDAIITLVPSGQVTPDVSDEVYVVGTLELPAEADATLGTVNKTLLHPTLRFAERVDPVFEKTLTYDWSSSDEACARSATYTGTDYTTLMAEAELYATVELQKLVDALAAREAALEAAG